ncbi:gliding motility lipoprotein GldH [Pseudotamlana carrageenivorans]|uniref:Gliding motility lipoprotein GldH n=1 Tax=Pseudotamlana carrageenivorans TaxID=2069432 RepID=A0A2I7SH82_9FLAO|nr:gliding motility lipoprotein GldH [Tamlana carrageenivorans]AUS05262.1 gliding motility lipoprotein GldH [Tamlana carrageenivorans]
MLKNRVLLLLVCVFFSLSSCDSKYYFDVYKSVPKKWHKDSVVSFKIDPPDSINPYNLFINLRNTSAYKYNNLFLIVEMVFPHGKTVKDTLEYKMAEPSGKFLGTGFGDIKENKLWYKEQVVFNESGKYKVNIQQAMRENGKVNGVEELEGITDVGFSIEQKKIKK